MILLDEVATQVLTFSVTVDGTALPSTVMISALRTHQSSSAPAEAEITVLVQSDDGFDSAPFKLLSIGAGVSVRLGYDGVEDTVFSGSIAGQELMFSDNGARLIVTCSGDPVPPVSDETVHELRLGVDVESYRGSIGASGSDATGELQMQGTGQFRPGASLRLPELPGRFADAATISGVDHEVEMGQWVTTVRFT